MSPPNSLARVRVSAAKTSAGSVTDRRELDQKLRREGPVWALPHCYGPLGRSRRAVRECRYAATRTVRRRSLRLDWPGGMGPPFHILPGRSAQRRSHPFAIVLLRLGAVNVPGVAIAAGSGPENAEFHRPSHLSYKRLIIGVASTRVPVGE